MRQIVLLLDSNGSEINNSTPYFGQCIFFNPITSALISINITEFTMLPFFCSKGHSCKVYKINYDPTQHCNVYMLLLVCEH